MRKLFIAAHEINLFLYDPIFQDSKKVNKTNKKKIEASVLSEEDQLMIAIQNSLREISSDCKESSPTNEMNGDSNDADEGGDDGVAEAGFESDSDVAGKKQDAPQSWNDYLGDSNGEPIILNTLIQIFISMCIYRS